MAVSEVRQKGEIVLRGRCEMSIGGVEEVINFDEESVRMKSIDGELFVEGREIKIGVLDTDRGVVTLTGNIDAIYYSTENPKEKKGFFGRLMR